MKLTQNEKNLMRRYLVWCYKTTKEELDKIDRYYTQEMADNFIVKELKKNKEFNTGKTKNKYSHLVKEFETYIQEKISRANEKKFINGSKKETCPEYQYLKTRLAGIEKAVEYFFGKKELGVIVNLYEEEMLQRILEAREHI